MSHMFFGCSSLIELPNISKINTINVTNMKKMFFNCSSLTYIDLSSFNTQNVKDMSFMFYNCCELTEIDISNWDFRSATKVNNMFHNCSSLKTIIFEERMNSSKIIDMQFMFTNCENLEKDLTVLSNWNTKNVVYMNNMVQNCVNIKESFDVSKWDIYNVKNFQFMLNNSSIKKPSWYD